MRAVLFDLDGTLVSSFNHNGHIEGYDTPRALPGRVERLARLKADHTPMGVVTTNTRQLGDQDERIRKALGSLGMPDLRVLVAPPDHKPPLIQRLLSELGTKANSALYVGNQESDRRAAHQAGVPFAYATDFFDPNPRRQARKIRPRFA